MREIKFRVWCPYSNEMYEDLSSEGLTLNEIFETNQVSSLNRTIMQYTGQKDTNDNEIWEGDILSFSSDDDNLQQNIIILKEVKWSIRHSAFILIWITAKEMMMSFIEQPYFHEIIGNIYENPELRIIKE